MLALLMLSLLMHPHASQGGKYAVQGRIAWDTVHSPTEPLRVRLESFARAIVGEAFTDGAGNFTFGGVPAGTYYVRATADGFQEVSERVDVPSTGSLVIFMNVETRLPAAGSDSRYGGSYIVNVRELAVPKEAIREYEKALKDMEKGNAATATERLEQAIRIAPDFFEAHVALAKQYRAAGRIGDAETHWTKAAEIRGHDAGPLVELGRLYMERGDASAALSVLERAVDRDPKDPNRSVAIQTRQQLMEILSGASPYEE